jgi:MFS family permease
MSFKFPFVLADKKKADMKIVRHCMDETSPDFFGKPRKRKDKGKGKAKPKFDPNKPSPPTSIIIQTPEMVDNSLSPLGHRAPTQAGDLACFLAGCAPGPGEFQYHPQRVSRVSFGDTTSPRSNSKSANGNTNIVDQDMGDEVAKFGVAIKGVRVKSPLLVQGNKRRSEAAQSSFLDPREGLGLPKSLKIKNLRQSKQSESDNQSPTVSTASSDAFPHVAKSQEVAAKEEVQLSTTVVTNFSLKSAKLRSREPSSSLQIKIPEDRKRTLDQAAAIALPNEESSMPGSFPVNPAEVPLPDSRDSVSVKPNVPERSEIMLDMQISDLIGMHQSENPVEPQQEPSPPEILRTKSPESYWKSKPKSPSLRSASSKGSPFFHALLKPSITLNEPVDTGVPIPPVLSPVAADTSEGAATRALKFWANETVSPSDLDRKKILDVLDSVAPDQELPSNGQKTDVTNDTILVDIDVQVADESVTLDQKVDNASQVVNSAVEEKPVSSIENQTSAIEPSSTKSPSVSLMTSMTNAKALVDVVKERVRQQSSEEVNNVYQAIDSVVEAKPSNPVEAQEIPSSIQDIASRPMKSISALRILLDAEPAVATKPNVKPAKPSQSNDPEVASTQNTKIEQPIPSENGSNSATQYPAALAEVDALNAAYWGFVPAVKEVVQDAIEVAVRKAVQEIIVPPGAMLRKHVETYLADNPASPVSKATEDPRQPVPVPKRSRSKVPRSSVDLANEYQQLIKEDLSSPVETPIVESSEQKSSGEPGTSNIRPADVSLLPTTRPTEQEKNSQSKNKPVLDLLQPNENMGSQKGLSTTEEADVTSVYDLRENLDPSTGIIASTEEMDNIPLENVNKTLAENSKSDWKGSTAWRKSNPLGYTAIPPRRSSKNRFSTSKGQSPSSLTKLSPVEAIPLQGSNYSRGSFERLSNNRIRALRSISSVGSIPDESVIKERPAQRLPSSEALPSASVDNDAVREDPSMEDVRKKSTVHWLRDLLSSNDPYETRFTDLPPRTRRDQDFVTRPIRSLTAPPKPVLKLFMGKTPKPAQLVPEPAERVEKRQAATSETFTRTINDLEYLMNEALFIARRAADIEDPKYAPTLLENAAAILKGGRKGYEDYIAQRRLRELSISYSMRRSDESNVPSVHESLRSYSGSSGSSGSNASEDDVLIEDDPIERSGPQLRIKVPTGSIGGMNDIYQSMHPSGWPPTGRSVTPYPPGSAVPSQADSMLTATPSAVDDSSADIYFGTVEEPKTAERVIDVSRQNEGQSTNTAAEPPKGVMVDPFSRADIGYVSQNKGAPSNVSPGQLSPEKVDARSRANTTRSRPSKFIEEKDQINLGLPRPPKRQKGVPVPAVTPGRRYTGEPLPADPSLLQSVMPKQSVPNKRQVRQYIEVFQHPPIQKRTSSLKLRKRAEQDQKPVPLVEAGASYSWQDIDENELVRQAQQAEIKAVSATVKVTEKDVCLASEVTPSFDGSYPSDTLNFDIGFGHPGRVHTFDGGNSEGRIYELRDNPNPNLPVIQASTRRRGHPSPNLFNLKGKSHISLRSEHHKGFSLTRSHKRQTIARDWAPARKRFVASVTCISTLLVGLLVGVYAAEVPSIQYYIVDFHHYTILGNVFFFVGLAIPTFLFWPLPLLHGRKPYILGSLSIAMPLLFPQALAVGEFRSPYVSYWRVGLLLPRAMMGFALGFANMNFKSTLTDVFGASLHHQNPHQEVVDKNDVRRHGGGMGVWLGIWTWCTIGSIGIGFLWGAIIIQHLQPAWGFYIQIAIIAGVMLLNVLCPEPRRSAFRRSVAEVKDGDKVSRRLARGEVKMHLVQSGPKWWGEEFHYGVMLSKKMLKQPGFMVLAVYCAWIYGQIVLTVVLVGSLMSNSYKFRSPYVGASVSAVPLGAFLSIPFQKASLFSRERYKDTNDDDDTFDKKTRWSDHMVRRCLFILTLPVAGIAYTVASNGPPTPFILPIIFAGFIGFLSNLALAECHGIIMETYDTSDLQPGMTGRPRTSSNDKNASKRTNYSSFPRVTSAFAITQALGYLIAAAATGVGGVATRGLGQQAATGVMAGIILVLSLLLLGVLVRFREVQIIPDSKKEEMDKWVKARRASAARRGSVVDEEMLRPVIIGNPTHHTRRMNVLEMGSLSRFSEIRRKNKLVDQNSLEAKHPNLAMVRDVEVRIREVEREVVGVVRRSLSREGSRRSKYSKGSDEGVEIEGPRGESYRMVGVPSPLASPPVAGDLGGFTEITEIARGGSGNGRARGGSRKERRGTMRPS